MTEWSYFVFFPFEDTKDVVLAAALGTQVGFCRDLMTSDLAGLDKSRKSCSSTKPRFLQKESDDSPEGKDPRSGWSKCEVHARVGEAPVVKSMSAFCHSDSIVDRSERHSHSKGVRPNASGTSHRSGRIDTTCCSSATLPYPATAQTSVTPFLPPLSHENRGLSRNSAFKSSTVV